MQCHLEEFVFLWPVSLFHPPHLGFKETVEKEEREISFLISVIYHKPHSCGSMALRARHCPWGSLIAPSSAQLRKKPQNACAYLPVGDCPPTFPPKSLLQRQINCHTPSNASCVRIHVTRLQTSIEWGIALWRSPVLSGGCEGGLGDG